MSKVSSPDSFEADHWCLLALKYFLFKIIYCTFYMAVLGHHAFLFVVKQVKDLRREQMSNISTA